MSEKVKVGITHGDINGVGYEILLKTFADERLSELFTPVIYGSSKSASFHRKVLDLDPVQFNIVDNVEEIGSGKLNFINCVKEEVKIELGVAAPAAGESAFSALETAAADLAKQKIDVLVTLPINKESIRSDKFRFPGHTEFLQDRFARDREKALMILTNDSLRVALVTSHIAIAQVPGSISRELIFEKLTTLNFSLKRDFRIETPRIAVLALNPHAGENGMFGKEEQETIVPALRKAQDAGILCAGPFAADGFFGSRGYLRFDAVLAMYHDQGLIPFKTVAMESGVNFTAGLPIVRTSPDHGTAYDIAGKNVASEKSLRQAIYMAVDIYKNRRAYDEARENPLGKIFFDRGKDDVKLDLTQEPE